MSASGHELPPWLQFSVSALMPKADIGLDRKNVRFGPEGRHWTWSQRGNEPRTLIGLSIFNQADENFRKTRPSLKNICRFGPRLDVSRRRLVHSGLMSSALMSGHHFSISDFWNAPSACALC